MGHWVLIGIGLMILLLLLDELIGCGVGCHGRPNIISGRERGLRDEGRLLLLLLLVLPTIGRRGS